MAHKPFLYFIYALLLASVLGACKGETPSPSPESISGVVLGEAMPLPGATVRVKTTIVETVTDSEGRFTLSGLEPGKAVDVTAWASGYYIVAVEDILPGTQELEIVLHPHHDVDNTDYEWMPSTYHPGEGEGQGCGQNLTNCRIIINYENFFHDKSSSV